ncbi:hypothetical protein [uncultured Desulfuromusa sp.]|uniref:hypothetical protein n=1 Tax=uncultured Desulfuromusa sp. TaxID=219183 RepID=UPI002AA84D5C|nr:hypothetical protein [uncultured Desulfuromusa sp.]
MKKSEKFIAAALTLLSASVSLVFFLYGAFIARGAIGQTWIMIFAILTACYGAGSLAALLWAWFKGGKRAIKVIKYLAIAFLALFVIGSMDVGMVSGQEFILILGVGLVIWFNWFSVKKIALWQQNA